MNTTPMENAPIDPARKDSEIKKRPFIEPRLAFVRPKLVRQGKVGEITAGFFGSFSP